MIIYCDGGSRGNPGKSASAIVVTNETINNQEDKNIIYKESKYLGINTNNFAEYSAVNMAIDWIIKRNIKEQVTINLDSQLVERQLNGLYKVKNNILLEMFLAVKNKIKDNSLKVKFIWGYRSKNKLADSLVNKELDKQSL